MVSGTECPTAARLDWYSKEGEHRGESGSKAGSACDLADSARPLALEQGEQSSDGIMGQPQCHDCQASPQRWDRSKIKPESPVNGSGWGPVRYIAKHRHDSNIARAGTKGEGLSLRAALGWRRGWQSFSQLCSQQPDYMLNGCTLSQLALSTGSPAPQWVLKPWTPTAVQKVLIYEFHGIIKCDCFLQ